MDSRKNATILIPSYQPTEVITILCRGLFDEGFDILVVDDGSGEEYASIFEKCKQYAEVISYPNNKGKGFALKTGFKRIIERDDGCEFVITADGDGQHLIQDIIGVYNKISLNRRVVIGDRTFDVKVPIKSRLGNGLSKVTQSLYTYRYLHDNQCGLRGFPTTELPAMLKIKGNRYEYEMNVITYMQYKEIPYETIRVQTIYENGNKGSHFRPIQDTLRIQSSLFLYEIPNLFCLIFNYVLACLLFTFVFSGQIPVDYEVSVASAYLCAIILQSLLGGIVFHPRYPGKMILRIIMYQALMLIATLVTVTFFSRVCYIPIYFSYLISFALTIVPLYYAVKGVGVVYESQRQ